MTDTLSEVLAVTRLKGHRVLLGRAPWALGHRAPSAAARTLYVV